MTEPNEIDETHPVWERFRAAGYPLSVLTDPGHVTPEDIETGNMRAVVWDSHGITAFDIGSEAVSEDDWSPTGLHVAHGHSGGTKQPIAFADVTGPLNEEIRPMSQLRGLASGQVVMFYDTTEEREFPDYTQPQAVKALGYWGSEGHMPRGTAEAICDAFDTGFEDTSFRDDPDVEGEEIIRPQYVAQKVASAKLGESKDADSSITGHKKRRRQRFYRNLRVLEDEFDIENSQ